MTDIVKVNLNVASPATIPLQKKYAMVTQGGTNTATGTLSQINQLSDIDDILADSFPIKALKTNKIPVTAATQVTATVSALTTITNTVSAAVWATGVVTVTTSAAHGLPASSTFAAMIAGFTPDALNGEQVITVTSTTQFTFPLAVNPGTVTTLGTASVVQATATAHGFGIGKTIAGWVGNAPSNYYNGARRCFVFDANTLYLSQSGGAANFTGLTDCYFNTVTLTATHGLVVGSVFTSSVVGLLSASYNNSRALTALAASGEIWYAVDKQPSQPLVTNSPVVYIGSIETLSAHSFQPGITTSVNVSGAVPKAFNTFFSCKIINSTTMYFLVQNRSLGSATTLGKVTDYGTTQLYAQVNTWFKQNDARGTNNPCFVLEAGNGTVASGLINLGSFIANNPGVIYGYVLPYEVVSNQLAGFANQYASQYDLTYFFTTDRATDSNLYGIKSIINTYTPSNLGIEKTGEFQAAAVAFNAANFEPTARKNSPLQFSTVYGVTPHPGKESDKKAIVDRNSTIIDTGIEGGINATIVYGGHTMDSTPTDSRDFSWWRAVNYAQIELDKNVANEVILGSDTDSVNPLYFNQRGIDRLQARAQSVVKSMADTGVIFEETTVNAIDFDTYTTQNPTHFAQGIYNGLSVTITPSRFLASITITLNVNFTV